MNARLTREAVTAVLIVVGAACGGESPGPVSPGGTGPNLHTVSGTVFEQTAQGRADLSSQVWFEYHQPGDSFWTGGSRSASDGRFSFEHVVPGTVLKLSARAHGDWRNQPCAVNAVVNGDLSLDLELVRPGSIGITAGAHRVGGVVYEMSASGRQPIADADVAFVSDCSGLQDVYARTDGSGRYAFCRVPAGSGCLSAGLERFGSRWFTARRVPVQIQGDVVVDVELTEGTPSPVFSLAVPRAGSATDRSRR